MKCVCYFYSCKISFESPRPRKLFFSEMTINKDQDILDPMLSEVSSNDKMSRFNNSSTSSSVTGNLNNGMLLDLDSFYELPLNTRIYEKRYSFSARNFNVNNSAQVTPISPEITCVKSKEKKETFKNKLSKNLICVTDGSSTSFRILNSTEKAELNSALLLNGHNHMNTHQSNVTSPKCASFSRSILSDGQKHEQITTKYVSSANA